MRSLSSNIYVLLVLASSCSARAVSSNFVTGQLDARATNPTVVLKNGTYVGMRTSPYNQDLFLGVPFAQPPTGNNRFRPPQPLNAFSGSRSVTNYPPYCAQGSQGSEDCLYLNVVRPSGLAPVTSSNGSGIPVAVWIHGGGLSTDGTADRIYNMSYFVQNSVTIGKAVIGVSIQYRLSSWGFIGGAEALAEGATNLGFKDQRLALHWIQENIGAFGGDKTRVTIMGESAGGASILAHLLAYGGRDDGLFRAAICESGYLYVTRPENKNNEQTQYNNIVKATSCGNTLSTSNSLACLRRLSYSQMNSAIESAGGPIPTVDGDFIRALPADQLASGSFLRVPFLAGANTDEGTAFFGGGVNSDSDFRNEVSGFASNSSVVDQFLKDYPNDDKVGIPPLTTFSGSFQSLGLGSQYRRGAAFDTDSQFMATRRQIHQAWAAVSVPSYSYRWDVTRGGEKPQRGATHGSEVPFVFDSEMGIGYDPNPFTSGFDAATVTQMRYLGKLMSKTWIALVHDLDPNAHGVSGAAKWPVYSTGSENLLWQKNGTSIEADNFRAAGIQLLIAESRTSLS